jgi:hypothetical protein
MCNIKFGYYNPWDTGTIGYTSQHYNFPAANSQERRLTSPWRSAYEENTGGGNFEITASNQKLYFNEGGGTFTATITIGTYNATDLGLKIKDQMEAVGAGVYTVTYDFDDLKFTIAIGTGTFELEGTNGTNAIWDTIGYDAVDTGLAASHEADNIRIHTYEYIQVSLTALANFDGLFIFNHNIQTTGTLKWQFSNNNFASIPLEVTPTRNGNIAVSLLSTVQSYDYIRIYIKDIDNPYGYVQVGRAWLSEMFTPTIGYNSGGSENPIDKSIVTEALSGENMSIQYPHIDRRSYRFDIAEPYSGFKSMYDTVGTSKPLVVVTRENVPDSLSFDNPEQYTLYCRLNSYVPVTIGGPRYKINLSVREEK